MLEIPETFQVSNGDLLTLVWNDEFDGVNLDPEVWFFATGDGTEKQNDLSEKCCRVVAETG